MKADLIHELIDFMNLQTVLKIFYEKSFFFFLHNPIILESYKRSPIRHDIIGLF